MHHRFAAPVSGKDADQFAALEEVPMLVKSNIRVILYAPPLDKLVFKVGEGAS